jgi:hypothetical protein
MKDKFVFLNYEFYNILIYLNSFHDSLNYKIIIL